MDYGFPSSNLNTKLSQELQLPFSASKAAGTCLPTPSLCPAAPWTAQWEMLMIVSAHGWSSPTLVGSSPTEMMMVFLVSCFKQQILIWAWRLPQVGFANKTTNGVPVEGFYRAVCFWVFSNYLCETLQTVKAPGYKKHVLVVEGKPFLFTEKYHNLFKGHKTSWNMRSKKYLHYSLGCPVCPSYKIGISTLKSSPSPGISEDLLTQQRVCVIVCGLFAVLWLIMASEAAGRGWPQRYIKWW